MSLYTEAKERITSVKSSLIVVTQDRVAIAIKKSIYKARQVPDTTRESRYRGIIVVSGVLQKIFPDYEYCFEGHKGVCYQALGEHEESFRSLQRAMSNHPDQSEKTDFPIYVENYLNSINGAFTLDGSKRTPLLREAVESLEQIIPKVPTIEYRTRGYLGTCLTELGRVHEALPNLEAALVQHPKPKEAEDFGAFYKSYMVTVRSITQGEIHKLNNGLRGQEIELALMAVINSTAHVGIKCGNLDGLHNEHMAANSWFEQSAGPKNIRTRGFPIRISGN